LVAAGELAVDPESYPGQPNYLGETLRLLNETGDGRQASLLTIGLAGLIAKVQGAAMSRLPG